MKLLVSILVPAAVFAQCKVQFNEHCSDCAHMVGDVYDASAGFGLPKGISGFKLMGDDDCQLKAFERPDFQGRSEIFNGDYCNFCAAGWNDKIMSFKLKGDGCTVQFNEHCSDCAHMVGETYEAGEVAKGLPKGISGFKISGDESDCELHVFAEEDFGGRTNVFQESVCNICSLPNWNDRMHSFQIGKKGEWMEEKDPKPERETSTPDECTVTFNQHCSDCWHLYGDEHTQSRSDNVIEGISGFKLEGPADCQLTLYDQENMEGRSETFTESVCNFCAYSWNDKVKSFNLEGEGCKVQFNEHCSDCQHMFGPTFDEPKAGGLPNGISGWKITGEECKLTIYSEEGWKGRSESFTESACNLCKEVNWNDQAQSFMLERKCGDNCDDGEPANRDDDGKGDDEDWCLAASGDNKECKKLDNCRYDKKSEICECREEGKCMGGGDGGGAPGGDDDCPEAEPIDVKRCKKLDGKEACEAELGCQFKKNKCKPMKKVKCKKINLELCCHFPGCKPDGKKCGGEFTGWK